MGFVRWLLAKPGPGSRGLENAPRWVTGLLIAFWVVMLVWLVSSYQDTSHVF